MVETCSGRMGVWIRNQRLLDKIHKLRTLETFSLGNASYEVPHTRSMVSDY